MARQKVRELETEIDKQQKFHDMELLRYQNENKMLQEFKIGYEKDLSAKDSQIKVLFQEIDRLKREKKEAISIVHIRDIDLSKAN